MVDLARISLACSAAESAGDLALNTELTCYDNVLKDLYGLFAVSQDYDTHQLKNLMGGLILNMKDKIIVGREDQKMIL